jgi:hypothetical protein
MSLDWIAHKEWLNRRKVGYVGTREHEGPWSTEIESLGAGKYHLKAVPAQGPMQLPRHLRPLTWRDRVELIRGRLREVIWFALHPRDWLARRALRKVVSPNNRPVVNHLFEEDIK